MKIRVFKLYCIEQRDLDFGDSTREKTDSCRGTWWQSTADTWVRQHKIFICQSVDSWHEAVDRSL